eukprot:TRINITY_DN1478_c0_g1_i1.p1 TRINITY_DN1478_c0_g1~~TRINITY_DN1478_c0_g1_i1.p1  ORF type:complete len:408 (-),score=91.86 TRINITY_DN1478_c0_g1_i1:169-1392(-)
MKLSIEWCIICLFIISLVKCEVIEITKNNMNLLLDSPCIVMFESSSCIQNQTFKTEYMNLDKKLKNMSIKPCYVNINENKRLVKKYSLNSKTIQPYFVFINGSESFNYYGERTIESLIKFCEEIENTQIQKQNNSREIGVERKVEFVICDLGDDIFLEELLKIARRYHQHLIISSRNTNCTANDILLKRQNDKEEYSLKFENKMLKNVKKRAKIEDFRNFFIKNLFPLVSEFNPTTYKNLANLNKKLVVFVANDTSFLDKNFLNLLNQFSSSYFFTFLVKPFSFEFFQTLNIKFAELPVTIVIDLQNDIFWKFKGLNLSDLPKISIGQVKPFGKEEKPSIFISIRAFVLDNPIFYLFLMVISGLSLVSFVALLSFSSLTKLKNKAVEKAEADTLYDSSFESDFDESD